MKKRKPKNAHSTAKNLAKPHGLRAGPQTVITPVVKEFAAKFKGKPSLELVRNIARFFKDHFEKVNLSFVAFSKIYAKRTAEDIIKSKKVVKLRKRNAHVESNGCLEYAVAVCAVLRAKGIKAFFVRHGAHSYALFEIEGKRYICDPTKEKRVMVREFSNVDQRMFNRARIQRKLALGADAWSVGIRGIEDFEKTF